MDFKGVPMDMRVPLVATRFRGRASAWWQQLKINRSRNGKSKITDWEMLKKKMRVEFLPHNYTQSTEQQTARYVGGLRQQIQDELMMYDLCSISDAHQRALVLEKWFGRRSAGNWGSTAQASAGAAPPTRAIPSQPAVPTAIKPAASTYKCFKCGEPGYRMADCRKGDRPGKALFVEPDGAIHDSPEGYDQEAVFDDGSEEMEEIVVEEDTGPLLVVRRVCYAPRESVGESWLLPCIKRIREIKEKQHHAHELVKILCMEIAKSNLSEVAKIFRPVMDRAIYYGVPEIVEEIIASYPMAINMRVQDDLDIFQYAIQCRCERVFNLIYQVDYGSIIVAGLDKLKNNALHLAASLKHEQQIVVRASTAGPVLQMQRELQWFKEVEKSAAPGIKEKRNSDGMTPAEVFSETHQNLVKDGEKWMKDTATSCTIVAALIATMVFAAAITVPGGNNSYNGHPILSKQKAFVIFGISDALALFSSITSVLMFLLILTSRYAEEDFLHTLPNRLVIGLITLFVSILSTMVAFGAILYLVFGDNQDWVLIPIIALAIIPATLFGALQLPLLVEMIQSTYGRSIFGKQSDRMLG
ncbi:hypothetical protein Vadar_019004 [Vaccinium darrowii]|uniref:Uncharacterized protein n=1 Tax=Vaccinium darrowii TaxID=229202 RepID=A0ACB7YN51_9ERIC|nr:hypothetical protein Vadar_019004 [Vaccinium darrowii]